ncbi:ABC transporter substrate-binding protein [Ornithinicoccus halotolerans]|uniref:ABC transporter substrate-binding protein n=1 Tax=Ornithinicoccus halotolerans TaxID=1748220 RepID=UPI00129709AF|nr:extracellular solute-binding protein [Ornithinicoccus halotolerans]
MGRSRRAAGLTGAVAALVLAACSGDDGRVELEFFQFKPEAVQAFDDIIAAFEAEHPGIRVVQNHVPDADTAIRTLLVKDKTPDVITLNGSGNFGRLATSCVFADLSDMTSVIESINPDVQQVLDDLGTCEDQVNGLPFASNASGVIYNTEVFEEHGLDVPRTWPEFQQVVEALEGTDVIPLYGTYADPWTLLPTFNNLSGAMVEQGFWQQMRKAGEDVGPESAVSFSNDYAPVAERFVEVFSYTQSDARSRGYDDGNRAMAEGEAAMLAQGSFTLPAIRAVDEEAPLGMFVMPAGEQESDNVLVSGVDVAVAIGGDTDHPEEARRFVEFMFSPEVVSEYATAQSALSPLLDAPQNDDPALSGILPLYEEGRITGYADHQIPAAVNLEAHVQTLVLSGDTDAFLAALDNEWRKVAARTIDFEEGG